MDGSLSEELSRVTYTLFHCTGMQCEIMIRVPVVLRCVDVVNEYKRDPRRFLKSSALVGEKLGRDILHARLLSKSLSLKIR